MAGSTYGTLFRITTWGESHGPAIGVVIDGCPSGLSLSEEDITKGNIVMGTGTIDTLGNVGEIGGVRYKLIGAVKKKAKVFLVPAENYEEAVAVKNEKNYDIQIIAVKTLKEALEALEKL